MTRLFALNRGGDHQPAAKNWTLLITLLKFGLSALAIGIVAYSVDLSAAWQSALDQSPFFFAVAIVILSIQVVLGGLRWHAVLERLGANPSLRESVRLYYISAFFNAYLWGAVGGDVLRAWLTIRGEVGKKTAVNSVIIDRIAALSGVAILVLVTTPIFLSRVGVSPPMFIPLAIAVCGLVGIRLVAFLDRLPAAWLKLRVVRLLHSLASSIRLVFFTLEGAAPVITLAIAAQLALGAATFAMASSIGINVSALDCIILIQPVALAANLPISIGGWGVRETAVILLFGLVGVPSSAALVLSLQLGVLSLLVVLPGGILWLLIRRKKRLA